MSTVVTNNHLSINLKRHVRASLAFHVGTSWCLEEEGRGFFDHCTKMKLLHFVMEEVFSAFPDEQTALLVAELAVS